MTTQNAAGIACIIAGVASLWLFLYWIGHTQRGIRVRVTVGVLLFVAAVGFSARGVSLLADRARDGARVVILP